MSIHKQIADWLESRWISPSYSGWLLIGLSIFFFASATNTLSGWLYVMSGTIFALLVVAAILSERTLRRVQVARFPIAPVSAGQDLTVELLLENPTPQVKTLLQVEDGIPQRLGNPVQQAFELISARSDQRWIYHQPTQQRGIYRWETVRIRTASPLGLFWCRRSWAARAKAIVYPPILPLTHCPLVDEIGREEDLRFLSSNRPESATEGLTRSLRPYRWGDSTRFIHWRTSARYGELRVRELEVVTGGQEIVVCLDSAALWRSEDFEQAVIAAISLFCYAARHHQTIRLWTSGTGLLKGERVVLEALAAIMAGEPSQADDPPTQPLIWLTQNVASLTGLPPGSRWLLWSADPREGLESGELVSSRGLVIESNSALQTQLQMPLQTRVV
ncbi:hypothetical protein BST81_13630 [Leptolyngbya sp. 'hensonii']|uniref:DUF58 domain-containing protein n=1 Tax=Leptolyngbya sp. 'hensonii' TaxID=1922337 RepID=UPI000950194E|nr:DUF58 domain-containing protein [Leptolyngbya sp. 'hensonii']OLP18063.1 hypothetical protein BST81_13630 [Leptolyngbya sp. 'hensonii']